MICFSRGKYALLTFAIAHCHSVGMIMIEISRKFSPGGQRKHDDRHNGHHGVTDWYWRWSRCSRWNSEKMFVLKNDSLHSLILM